MSLMGRADGALLRLVQSHRGRYFLRQTGVKMRPAPGSFSEIDIEYMINTIYREWALSPKTANSCYYL
jgi:hypothetical protein